MTGRPFEHRIDERRCRDIPRLGLDATYDSVEQWEVLAKNFLSGSKPTISELLSWASVQTDVTTPAVERSYSGGGEFAMQASTAIYSGLVRITAHAVHIRQGELAVDKGSPVEAAVKKLKAKQEQIDKMAKTYVFGANAVNGFKPPQ